MDNENLVEIVLADFELLFPLSVAIEYLVDEVMDDNVEQDFIESGLNLVEVISENHTDIEDLTSNLLSSIENKSDDLKQNYLLWETTVLNDLFEALFDLINDNYDFKDTQIRTIIEFIIGARYNNVKIFTDLFELLTSKGHKIPMETFGIGMYILERYGYIKSNHQLHPKYFYSKPDDTQHEFHECTVCSTQGNPYLTVYSFEHKNFNNPHLPFKLWMKCDCCGSCYSRYTTSEFYNKYVQHNIITPENLNKSLSIEEPNPETLHHWGQILNKLSNINNSKKLLTVGDTDLNSVALEFGFDIDILEPSIEQATIISNTLQIPVHNCNLVDFDTDDKYSIIILKDIIEKSFAPIYILNKAAQLLEDDGVLWLTTPNFESGYTRLLKEKSSIWSDPENISLFSKNSLEKLLQNNGLKVIEYNVSKTKNGYMELLIQKI